MSVPSVDVLKLDPEARKLLFTEARTANAFTDEPVTDAQLDAIFSLSQWPPTMANTNPLRWVIARSPEAKQRLNAHMSDGNKEKTLAAPLNVVLAADVDFHEQMPKLFPQRPQMRDSFGGMPAELRERKAKDNAWLQAGYFILAVRAAGLAAGPMLGFDAEAMDQEFLADTSWRSILVCNVGVPAAEGAWFDRLPRLGWEDVAREV